MGIKAVNALSDFFEIQAYRDGETRSYQFCRGKEIPKGRKDGATEEPNGTRTAFHADPDIFPAATQFRPEYIEKMCRYYSYLNKGLALHFNGRRYISKNGLLDLLAEAMSEEPLYPIIHLEGHDIEVAFTHGGQYGEEHYSFVNGQHTTQGGTHQAAFREAIVKTLRDFFKKNYEAGDIRSSLVAAISIKVKEPVFESQTKTKLGSNTISPEGETIRTFVGNFIARELDNYLHKTRKRPKPWKPRLRIPNGTARNSPASRNWRAKTPARPKFTTRISGTAGCITTPSTPAPGKPPSSLRKASPPPALSRRRATRKPRPFSPCGASR